MTEAARVTFIDHAGERYPVDAELEQSLMEAAVIDTGVGDTGRRAPLDQAPGKVGDR